MKVLEYLREVLTLLKEILKKIAVQEKYARRVRNVEGAGETAVIKTDPRFMGGVRTEARIQSKTIYEAVTLFMQQKPWMFPNYLSPATVSGKRV